MAVVAATTADAVVDVVVVVVRDIPSLEGVAVVGAGSGTGTTVEYLYGVRAGQEVGFSLGFGLGFEFSILSRRR